MRNYKILLRIFIFLGILVWCAGFSFNLLSPDSNTSLVFTPLLNLFYDNVCHQSEDKLILFNKFHFLVCARCAGIYSGALAASALLLIFVRKILISSKYFLIVSLILLSDVILNNYVFNPYNKISAFITGLLFGLICFIITLNLLEEYLLKPNESI
jgi:uncharacterized membrane protein